jgi:uracil-DNA glycosylase
VPSWPLSELELVKPRLVVCMGATAVTSLLGREIGITANRGKFFDSCFTASVWVTPQTMINIDFGEMRACMR